MVQEPKVLVTTFEQWKAYLTQGEPPDHGLWDLGCMMIADRIQNATQLAKGFSIHIARYCDDFTHGRAPGFLEGMDKGFADEDPESDEYPYSKFDMWSIQVDSYIEFFTDALEFHRVLSLPEWSSKLPNTYRPPWNEEAAKLADGFVTPEGVALLLKTKNKVITPKTLKNSYKAAWGTPDGKDGRAETFYWKRICPIVEDQFKVKFGN